MDIKRSALLLISPAVLAHTLAFPIIAGFGGVLDASIAKGLMLAGLGGYSLAGGVLAYRYALETSRSPWPWALGSAFLPFMTPLVLGTLKQSPPPLASPGLLPPWNFEPPGDVPETAYTYTNPEWNLSLPLATGWRITQENTPDSPGRQLIAALEGEETISGRAGIKVCALGCAHTFSPDDIAAYAERHTGPLEPLLKSYHETFKDEFLHADYRGQAIHTEGEGLVAGLPAVMFLGSFLSQTGRMFEQQITMFAPGGACQYLCSMPEEQRESVERYFRFLTYHCAPFVRTRLWNSKLLELEPVFAPLSEEDRLERDLSLPLITPHMLEPDSVPEMPPLEIPVVWEWRPGSFDVPELLETPNLWVSAHALSGLEDERADVPEPAGPVPQPAAGAKSATAKAAAQAKGPIVSWEMRPPDSEPATPLSPPEPAVTLPVEGPIVSWEMRPPAATPMVVTPLVTWELRRRAEPPPPPPQQQQQRPAGHKPAAGSEQTCARCGASVLPRSRFVQELSSQYGITLIRDDSGRVKVRGASGEESAGKTAALRAAVGELQRNRAMRCTHCGAVHCLSCLGRHAMPQADNLCPSCRSDNTLVEL